MSGKPSDIEKFLAIGDGSGYGDGDGDGSGYGYGDGSGYGDGDGDGSGSGYGDGDGDGSGDGSGYGYGDGSGYGYGDGSGSGYGYGSGYGDGVKSFNGHTVHYIDDVPTIIRHVVGAYAKGFILNRDLTLTPTYIARCGNCFAHGAKLREANAEARCKDMAVRPLDERLEAFKASHPDVDADCDGKDLFTWHGLLTGSCNQGRLVWCKAHELDPKTTTLTVRQFCELTSHAYGGEVIRKLAKAYHIIL